MRVGDLLPKTVVYLCWGRDGEPVGTAFFVNVPVPGTSARQHYLVTARHVLPRVKLGDEASQVFVRLNRKEGGASTQRLFGEWWTPTDPGVDLAVMPFDLGPPYEIDAASVCSEMFATDEIITSTYEIGIGDDVFAVGLFTNLAGDRRNRPIVRFGTIAAMPDEPIVDKPDAAPYRAYLVEMRSTGGQSGSPVSIFLGYPRDADGHRTNKSPGFLLGVIHGHYPVPPNGRLPDEEDPMYEPDKRHLNRGIALVTPIQELAALLAREDIVAHRNERAAKNARDIGRVPVLDSAANEPTRGPEPERLKIVGNWEDAVQRALRTPKSKDG